MTEAQRARFVRSLLAMQEGAYERAASELEAAVASEPRNAVFLSNLGEVYRRIERPADAERVLRSALAVEPKLGEAHYNLGLTLERQGRASEAARCYEAALRAKPGLPGVVERLIQALRAALAPDQAIAAFERYGQTAAQSPALLNAGANAFADLFRTDEAAALFQRSLELDPRAPVTHAEYASVLADQGEIALAVEHLERAVELDPGYVVAHQDLVYLAGLHPNYDAQQILSVAQSFERHVSKLVPLANHGNSPAPERRLRIGYVSADFRTHAASLFTLPVLRGHDREQFEVTCYSNASHADAMTERLRSLSDHWHDVTALDDDALASLIRADGIDICVDLGMHAAGNRLLALARKPAPLQVCWLAYPGTTGLSAIDYRISDPFLDPPDLDERCYSERTLRLPETYWCYEPFASDLEVGPLPALSSGCITFGCLNNLRKVSPRALALFAAVLQAVEGSRLRLVASGSETQRRVRAAFERAGVEAKRVEFFERARLTEYLRWYDGIDCALDTTPYNGATTSLDAIWMGVPLVTLVGDTVFGRAGASIASNLGLPELVAQNPEEYVARAAALCGDRERLAELRQGLRQRLQQSPLMDAARFVRHLEDAYRQIWRRWCDTRSH